MYFIIGIKIGIPIIIKYMYNGQSFRLVPIKHADQKLKAFATAYSCHKCRFYLSQSPISLVRCILFTNYNLVNKHMKTIKK